MGIILERVVSRMDDTWDAFLDTAPDATLFDRLSFLDYHPEQRFREHRLRAVQDGKTLAVIALAEADLDDASLLVSPYGASLGGWITSPDVRGGDHFELANLLSRYAESHAFDGVVLGIRPTPYHAQGEWLEFAWGERGAKVTRREINHFVPLGGDVRERFRGSARRSARKAERDGARVRRLPGTEVRSEDLALFHDMLVADKARKDTTPTHSLLELRELFARFPNEFELLLAGQDSEPAAALLVIRCSSRVSMVFYSARGEARAASGCVNLLYEYAALQAAGRGCEWLDLGTSSIDGRVNAGLSWFKESVGGVPFVRASWRLDLWRAAEKASRHPQEPAAEPEPGAIAGV